MRILPPNVPPALSIETPWRELWRLGAFTQEQAVPASQFSSRAAERDLRPGVGVSALEELDLAGALQPIMFAQGWVRQDVVDAAPYEECLQFREEHATRDWSEYARGQDDHPRTDALYTSWQILYLDDVLERAGESLPLSLLVGPPNELSAWIEKLQELIGHLENSWSSLDDQWQPLLKLLVRLQNRYLPEISRRVTQLWDQEAGERINPWQAVRQAFDAQSVAAELGVDVAQLQTAYWFLVERGIRREPRDGMELLRRARPRSAHVQWRGPARHAEDHFEAAHMLHLFLSDLTGSPPPRPDAWPYDGRQDFRAFLFERGPVPDITRDEIRGELYDVDLDPHAVHVVGEGRCEMEYVATITRAFVGTERAERIGYTDLKGAGAAALLPTIVRGLSTYVDRTVVIVDSEGAMKDRTDELERTGALPAGYIMRFERNIEEDNFEPPELIAVLCALAATPPPGFPPVELTITEANLQQAYARRSGRGRREDDPGLAGVLLQLAEQHDPPVRITKPDLSIALAERLLDEFEGVKGESRAEEELFERRPILRFIIERLVPAL